MPDFQEVGLPPNKLVKCPYNTGWGAVHASWDPSFVNDVAMEKESRYGMPQPKPMPPERLTFDLLP
jgi:hypothetical protein